MFKTLRDAFKVKEIRMGLLFTFFVFEHIARIFVDNPFWFVDPGTGTEYSRNQGIFGERAR